MGMEKDLMASLLERIIIPFPVFDYLHNNIFFNQRIWVWIEAKG